jgi:hypothetical protein
MDALSSSQWQMIKEFKNRVEASKKTSKAIIVPPKRKFSNAYN